MSALVVATLASAFLAIGVAPAVAVDYPVCDAGARVTCVVDGDTFWLRGEKIRISNIDAPEMDAACDAELRLALVSMRRLGELLASGRLYIRREGLDRNGRTLATIAIDGEDIGDQLVAEGLARTWTGRREPWC
ncbi:MAG: hypothetical protein B7Z15_17375 [Rhizobiales bacterium 32-66-8]|nr:MAG: hypothetical protein B7Z15_17375 [Rhizobiales bacterium 32-66-8]